MRMERQIKKFYVAWSPTVMAFACLLLGEGVDAERTAVEAFHDYVSRELDLDVLQLPVLLLIYALDAARKTSPSAASDVPRRMQEAVVLLPWTERAVFALRGAMGRDDMTVSEIVEIPVQEVRRVWMNALIRLRELLPKEVLQGRKT
jgi:DNA-directed RNA polymerase specialized sigma24 family protein